MGERERDGGLVDWKFSVCVRASVCFIDWLSFVSFDLFIISVRVHACRGRKKNRVL